MVGRVALPLLLRATTLVYSLTDKLAEANHTRVMGTLGDGE